MLILVYNSTIKKHVCSVPEQTRLLEFEKRTLEFYIIQHYKRNANRNKNIGST